MGSLRKHIMLKLPSKWPQATTAFGFCFHSCLWILIGIFGICIRQVRNGANSGGQYVPFEKAVHVCLCLQQSKKILILSGSS